MLGITLDTSFAERPYQGRPRFQILPAPTQLAISFEGIYTESKQGGGERVLCLLGSAMLPSRESDTNNPWEWLKDSDQNENKVPLLLDDQILLVLHYPLTHTLTNRVIRGELKSLNPKSNAKYFDQVRILAQMLKSTKYEFGSNEIVSKACDPYPYRDNVMNSGIDVYKLDSFCAILEQVTNSGAFTVARNWKCNGTDDYCSKLGPFVCKPINGHRNASVARVAAVFRAAPESEDQYRVQWRRSGLSNMTLAAEGIWNSTSGQLCMTMDLESGLDCLIEVIVSYPPTTARWLVNPTARISISSQRTEDDPLYFGMIKLQTLPIMYRKQREDVLSRRGVEGILRVLTLSFAIACISSQLFYLNQDVDSSPFISLVMLGVQALGYSLPLITGAEALLKREASDSYEMQSYDLEKSQWLSLIDYTVKHLVLVMFLLTLRLCQKVWKSCIRLLSRAPLESHRVPSDKRVLIATVTIHVIGYIIVLIIHTVNTKQIPLQTDRHIDSRGNSQTLRQWEIELEEYVGLVQDFFLLPQVIGNFRWQIDCKPLRKLYFIGISVVRLLPHFYDYMRAPVPNPYFAEEYEFVNPTMDFFSNFGMLPFPSRQFCLQLLSIVSKGGNMISLARFSPSGNAGFFLQDQELTRGFLPSH
ncbi:hypothetical protein F3Y22_tig00110430pilonHSYRG00287 [Hibiscus syriacus]|uniref:RING-type E3 ubiquitin transferase n=1 Tax=Hibiscus syriacus TaxID=106335 RepID=A0A6A3ANZ5_HIBSY|nr:hypothetical protein F3Y22_tig00110430pilonHSYRG00287 [Hibiscus syriacus]